MEGVSEKIAHWEMMSYNLQDDLGLNSVYISFLVVKDVLGEIRRGRVEGDTAVFLYLYNSLRLTLFLADKEKYLY